MLVGDIGGTNVRLKLDRVCLSSNVRIEIKKFSTYDSQKAKCFEEVLKEFLQNVSKENYPEVGVVGIAGPVTNNKCTLTNITHWPTEDGDLIGANWNMDFKFVNDFTIASYGASTLTHKDIDFLGTTGEAHIEDGANSMKIIVGPGTGLGVGILAKNEEDELYHPMPSEGGHIDFTV